MVTETTVVGVRLTKNDIVNLNAIVEKTGMNQSEVVRQLLKKAVGDEKCLQIITQNSFNEKAYARELRRTSYNVQNERKADEPYRQPTGCCPEPQVKNITDPRLKQIVLKAINNEDLTNEEIYYSIGHWPTGLEAQGLIHTPERLQKLQDEYIEHELEDLFKEEKDRLNA